jgi:pimeloyl-ACP methyl ester carboxylesterase
MLAVALVALVVAVVPLLWPIPPLRGTVPARELADAESRFLDVGAVELHYTQAGAPDAPSVILLHGFGASTFSWRHTMPALGECCRVIAFDRPAFGLTSRPMPGEWDGPNPYSPEAQADQTIALMDALGIEQAALVAHSAGAVVAMLVASSHPDRVSALVLEAPALGDGGGPPAWASPLLRTPQARRIGPLLVRRLATPDAEDSVRRAFADQSKVTAAVLEGYRRPLRADDWDRALWEYTAAPRRRDPQKLLPGLQMPVFVVWGDRDAFVAPADSRRVAATLQPPGRELEMRGVGHIPHEERPDAFNEAALEFIRETANEASRTR